MHFFERVGSGDTTSCSLIGCDGGSGEAIEWTGDESTNDIKVSDRFSHQSGMYLVSRIAGRNDRLQEDLRAVAEVTERLDELGVERWGDIGEGYRRLLLKRKRTTAEEAKSVVEEEISSYCRVLETLKDGWKTRWRQTYPHLHVVWYEASNAHGL